MHVFYIEMGQGIVAKAEFGVTTSALSSCRFLFAWKESGNLGGAFHYPGLALRNNNQEIKKAMLDWARNFQFEKISVIGGSIPQNQDDFDLEELLDDVPCLTALYGPGCTHPLVRFKKGGPQVEDNLADPLVNTNYIHVHEQAEGKHRAFSDYTLYGRDENKTK